MTNHVAKGRPKQRGSGRGLSLLLLLPLMCGVIFLASRVGAGNFSSGTIERQVTPVETANYSPWNEIIFAPVDDALLTDVGRDESGATAEYAGIATARPTVDRRPPVGVPASIAQYITSVATNETIVDSSDSVTEVAQVATSEQNQADANTDNVESTTVDGATATDIDTDTPVPSDTVEPTTTATETALPTDTDTPVPSATPIPTSTAVSAPVVNFGASPQSGSAPLTVTFTNLSSGNITVL